jgi:hypothetical protein
VRKSRTTRLRSVFALGAVVALACSGAVAACGFSGEGTFSAGPGSEAGTPETSVEPGRDAAVDAAPLDDGGSTVLLDAAGTIPNEIGDAATEGGCAASTYLCAATNTCVTLCGGCPGASYRCANTSTCVSGCGACGDRGFECTACGSNGTTLVKLTCEKTATDCYVDGARHCNCGALGGCYSAQQVCSDRGFFTYDCRTCGEPDTSNETCVGTPRTKCNPALKMCK